MNPIEHVLCGDEEVECMINVKRRIVQAPELTTQLL
jgi:hypothetical protein